MKIRQVELLYAFLNCFIRPEDQFKSITFSVSKVYQIMVITNIHETQHKARVGGGEGRGGLVHATSTCIIGQVQTSNLLYMYRRLILNSLISRRYNNSPAHHTQCLNYMTTTATQA